VLGRVISYFVKKKKKKKKLSETAIINMHEFWIDNIFAMLGRCVFMTVGIPGCKQRSSSLAELFLNSYEADFIQGLLKKNEKKLARFI
jgi:RNase adaptor protein for sRNA GlmZ degradation